MQPIIFRIICFISILTSNLEVLAENERLMSIIINASQHLIDIAGTFAIFDVQKNLYM